MSTSTKYAGRIATDGEKYVMAVTFNYIGHHNRNDRTPIRLSILDQKKVKEVIAQWNKDNAKEGQ